MSLVRCWRVKPQRCLSSRGPKERFSHLACHYSQRCVEGYKKKKKTDSIESLENFLLNTNLNPLCNRNVMHWTLVTVVNTSALWVSFVRNFIGTLAFLQCIKKKKFQPMKPGVFRISEFSSLDGAAVDVHDSKSSAHIVHELDGWASTGRLRVARVLCLLDLS